MNQRTKNGLYIIGIGLLMGVLVTLMQWAKLKWVMIDNSFELYAILIAFIFTGIGIWAGNQLIKRKTQVVEKLVEVEKTIYVESPVNFDREQFLQKTGISDRELEVLLLIVKGSSNQEIADELFLSVSTVKTHISNIFLKLEVNRRTQAVQKARSWGIS
jgi:NarL family two-component system response regulator LiaR